jgi:Cytochrome P460
MFRFLGFAQNQSVGSPWYLCQSATLQSYLATFTIMKIAKLIFLSGAIGILLLSFTRPSLPMPRVPYPEGFRTWKHIKTGFTGPNNPTFKQRGGFHHIYANDKAVDGYKSNHFADGSIIAFDVIEAIDKNSDFSEGKRRLVDVMVKDSVLYASTGGWGFEEFIENNKTEGVLKDLAVPKCFNCHATVKSNSFVFSKARD